MTREEYIRTKSSREIAELISTYDEDEASVNFCGKFCNGCTEDTPCEKTLCCAIEDVETMVAWYWLQGQVNE